MLKVRRLEIMMWRDRSRASGTYQNFGAGTEQFKSEDEPIQEETDEHHVKEDPCPFSERMATARAANFTPRRALHVALVLGFVQVFLVPFVAVVQRSRFWLVLLLAVFDFIRADCSLLAVFDFTRAISGLVLVLPELEIFEFLVFGRERIDGSRG